MASAMDVTSGLQSGGAVAAARSHIGESSRVNLGARRSLPQRDGSIPPPMPFPFTGTTGRDPVHYLLLLEAAQLEE